MLILHVCGLTLWQALLCILTMCSTLTDYDYDCINVCLFFRFDGFLSLSTVELLRRSSLTIGILSSVLGVMIKMVPKLCVCILLSVSAEILSCRAVKVLKFNVTSPSLVTSITVYNFFPCYSSVHELTPMVI